MAFRYTSLLFVWDVSVCTLQLIPRSPALPTWSVRCPLSSLSRPGITLIFSLAQAVSLTQASGYVWSNLSSKRTSSPGRSHLHQVIFAEFDFGCNILSVSPTNQKKSRLSHGDSYFKTVSGSHRRHLSYFGCKILLRTHERVCWTSPERIRFMSRVFLN